MRRIPTHAPLLGTLFGTLFVWGASSVLLSGLASSLHSGAPASQDMEYRKQPAELGPRAPRLGEWIPDLALTGAEGAETSLAGCAGPKGTVVFLRDPDCPLAKKFSPLVGRLAKQFQEQGLGVVLAAASEEERATDLERHGFEGAYVVDGDRSLARTLAAKTSTEVFVLDAARTLVYRGMINDQYGLGFTKQAATREYLQEAVAAVAKGETVTVPATVAQGCVLDLEDVPAATVSEVTYHNRVSRIVQDHCQVCHRPGGAGPFSLTNYEEVKKRKGMIEWVLEDKIMPPWFAAEDTGPWANDMGLTDQERSDLMAWIAAGAPEGEAEHAPAERQWVEGWTIGEPDLIVPMPESFTVPAEGFVDYQQFYTKLDTTEDRWVQAVEIRAGAKSVVHHVLVFLESPEVMERIRSGDRSAFRELQGGEKGFFAGTVPGQLGVTFPEGLGKKLPAGAWLKWQLHYTPDGTERVDRSEIGFVFADGPVEEIHTDSAYNDDFAIPPMTFDHEVSAEFTFPEDAAILSFFPHTHLRGYRFQFDLVSPGGDENLLLELPFYDFNWQLAYDLLTPRVVPKGSRLRATAWYDNTPENPANPDPKAWVRFGEQTFEEMMIGYVNWAPAASVPAAQPKVQ